MKDRASNTNKAPPDTEQNSAPDTKQQSKSTKKGWIDRLPLSWLGFGPHGFSNHDERHGE